MMLKIHSSSTTSTGRVVSDLGTKFVIRQRPNDVQVALASRGSAHDMKPTASDGMRRSVILDPGDVVLGDVPDSVSLAGKPALDLKSALGWRRGVLVFRHATLADAVAEFNRYNDEKLVIGDPSIARLGIHRGTFRTADVALFSRMVQEALGLRASIRGNEITITR